MVQVEQTEFWSDVEVRPLPALTTSFPGRGASVYIDEAAGLTDWFIEHDEGVPEIAPEPVEKIEESIPEGATDPEPEVSEATEHAHVGGICRARSDLSTSKFNMARFLTLTGSLDSVEEEGRYLVLPRRSFRPRVMLDAVRRISQDFLKDLRSPPRSYSITSYQRPPGWMKL